MCRFAENDKHCLWRVGVTDEDSKRVFPFSGVSGMHIAAGSLGNQGTIFFSSLFRV